MGDLFGVVPRGHCSFIEAIYRGKRLRWREDGGEEPWAVDVK
jgi:hypothetical protein